MGVIGNNKHPCRMEDIMAELAFHIRDLAQAAEHMANITEVADKLDEPVLKERALEATENISKVVQLMSRRALSQGKLIYEEG